MMMQILRHRSCVKILFLELSATYISERNIYSIESQFIYPVTEHNLINSQN